jgi:hypothetical protein
MSKLGSISFSENMNYLFTDKGVTKLSLEENDLNGKNFVSYTYDNLNIAIDILKENMEFRFKTGKISLLEYTSEPRKFLYSVLEIVQPKNPINIIKEWESNFGDKLILINESSDKLLLEEKIDKSWNSFKILFEQWYNPLSKDFAIYQGAKNVYDWGQDKINKGVKWAKEQGKEIKDKGFINWAKDSAKSIWNKVKNGITSAWKCVTENPVECIMEGMRSLVFTAGGVAALTGLSMIPVVGQVSNGIIFGSLLIWDIYKWISGKYESGKYQWSVMDIVVDSISLLAPYLGKIVKTLGLGVKSFTQLGKLAATKGGVLSKIVTIIKSGIGKLSGFIRSAAKWLGEKLGLTSMVKWGEKANTQLTKMSDDLTTGINSVKQPSQLKQIWKKTPIVASSKSEILKKMNNSFAFAATFCAALNLDGLTCKEKIEKGEISDEKLKMAQEKANQELSKKMGKSIEDIGGVDQLSWEM